MNKDMIDGALEDTSDTLADEYDYAEIDFVCECVATFVSNLNNRLEAPHPAVQAFLNELLKTLA